MTPVPMRRTFLTLGLTTSEPIVTWPSPIMTTCGGRCGTTPQRQSQRLRAAPAAARAASTEHATRALRCRRSGGASRRRAARSMRHAAQRNAIHAGETRHVALAHAQHGGGAHAAAVHVAERVPSAACGVEDARARRASSPQAGVGAARERAYGGARHALHLRCVRAWSGARVAALPVRPGARRGLLRGTWLAPFATFGAYPPQRAAPYAAPPYAAVAPRHCTGARRSCLVPAAAAPRRCRKRARASPLLIARVQPLA